MSQEVATQELAETWAMGVATTEELAAFVAKLIIWDRQLVNKVLNGSALPDDSVGGRKGETGSSSKGEEHSSHRGNSDNALKLLDKAITAQAPQAGEFNRSSHFFKKVGEHGHIFDDEKISDVREREMSDFEKSKTDIPVVQFSAPMYFGNSAEDASLVLDVIRIGESSGVSEVSFKTQCGSAKKGVKYIESEGKILFPSGSTTEQLTIQLVSDKHWDTTTEFEVRILEEPAVTKNCSIGLSKVARVKIINEVCFPNDKYADDIKNERVREMGFWGIFWEYWKVNFSNPVVKRGTLKIFMMDACNNLYLLLSLFVNVYLVDNILKKCSEELRMKGTPRSEECDNAEVQLMALAALLIVPYAGLHYIEFRKTTWKVGGASRAKLQNALLCKYQNYSQQSRSRIEKAELMMAMTRDCPAIVQEGYVKGLSIVKMIGSLVVVLIFQLSVPSVFDLIQEDSKKRIPQWGLAVMVAFPAVLIPFLFLRRARTTAAMKLEQQKVDDIVQQVDNTVSRQRLIADYGQRPKYEKKFEGKVGSYNKVRVAANQVLLNNKYFAQWLTNIFAAAYIIIGGTQVVNGNQEVGMFLANLSTIKTIGSAWGTIYTIIMEMEVMSPDFRQVVIMLNLPTDVPQRRLLNRDRREKTAVFRKEAAEKLKAGWPVDNLPIILDDLTYSYSSQTKAAFKMQGGLKIHLHQGEFISFMGPRGEGKATLLQMLAQVFFPETATSLFVPSHLRVLNVSSEILFTRESLFSNVTFGTRDATTQMDRVVAICKRLQIPQQYIDAIQKGPDGKVEDWAATISSSHKNLLSLARALVFNPQVLCLHRPLDPFDDELSEVVLQVLFEFCRNKGVEVDPNDRHSRRPRTCLITTNAVETALQTDRMFLVNEAHGIVALPRHLAEEFVAGVV